MEVSKSDIESNKKKKMSKVEVDKVLFGQRFCAYIIDVLIVSIIAGLISTVFIDADKLSDLTKRLENVTQEITTSQELDELKFEEYIDACYDVARYQGIIMFVELIIIILYYVVYQIYKDGQTYGKKLMKIKIVSTKGDLTMNQMIFRTCFSTSLLINLFSLFVLTFSSKYAFFYGTLSFEFISYCVFAISVLMVMFGTNGMALHDKFFNTKVVKVN